MPFFYPEIDNVLPASQDGYRPLSHQIVKNHTQVKNNECGDENAEENTSAFWAKHIGFGVDPWEEDYQEDANCDENSLVDDVLKLDQTALPHVIAHDE